MAANAWVPGGGVGKSRPVTIRLEPDVHERIQKRARQKGVSISAVVEDLAREQL
jgi:predicted HicB family RNase H-like nuclease